MEDNKDLISIYNMLMAQSTISVAGGVFSYSLGGEAVTPYQVFREACDMVHVSKQACKGFISTMSYGFRDNGRLILNESVRALMSGGNAFSFVMPILIYPTASRQFIFSIWSDIGGVVTAQLYFSLETDGSIRFVYSTDGTETALRSEITTALDLTNPTDQGDYKWQMLGVTYDPGTSPRVLIYNNGVQQGVTSSGADGNIFLTDAQPIISGYQSGNNVILPQIGYMNYMAIYDTVLSPADMNVLYNNGDFLGGEFVAGLKNYYLFDNDTELRVVDEISQEHGVVQNTIRSPRSIEDSADKKFLTNKNPYNYDNS